MENKSQVTGTGIAVAIAVVMAGAFLFFGPSLLNIFSRTNNQQVATTTMETSNENTNIESASSTSSTASTTSTMLSGIPANPTELMVKDLVAGTGVEAKAGDTVTVQYVGMLTNGQVFDASANHGTTGFTFPLGAGQVIKGWDEGVVGMKVGGKRELIIPASLGYGGQSVGSIPANSTLVFEVDLEAIK
jgi:FKBP-type peptidyl-prolyl cis-trans isomerase